MTLTGGRLLIQRSTVHHRLWNFCGTHPSIFSSYSWDSPRSVLQCGVTSLTGVKDPWMDKRSEPSSLRERRALCWHLGNRVLFCPGLARCLHFEPETNANKGEERWREMHLWWHHDTSLWLSPVSVVSPVASKITGKPLRTGSWSCFWLYPGWAQFSASCTWMCLIYYSYIPSKTSQVAQW